MKRYWLSKSVIIKALIYQKFNAIKLQSDMYKMDIILKKKNFLINTIRTSPNYLNEIVKIKTLIKSKVHQKREPRPQVRNKATNRNPHQSDQHGVV